MKKITFYFLVATLCFGGKILLQASHAAEPISEPMRALALKMIQEAGTGSLTEAKLQEYIKQGVNVDTKNAAGNTAIMNAALYDQYPIVELLLRYKADPNLQDELGNTALMKAAKKYYIKIVQLLLNKDANPYLKNKENKTLLELFPGILKNPDIKTELANNKWVKIWAKQKIAELKGKIVLENAQLIPDVAEIIAQYAVELGDNPVSAKEEKKTTEAQNT